MIRPHTDFLCEVFCYLHSILMQVIIMTSIQNLRNQIDQLDHQLLVLLAQRQQIVEKIGQLKPINSQAAVTAPDRVKQVLLNRQQEAEKLGLSPDVALSIGQTMSKAFTALELKINSNHDLNRK